MEIVLEGDVGKQKILKPTPKDVLLVENLNVRKVRKNKVIDFKNSIVSKPWGAEYLCGRNKNIEVWGLHINPQAATSLHCHPNKDTLNIIIEGRVLLETIGKKEILLAGDFKLLKAGVIHKTINFDSRSRVRILEIESPPNKYNLIRVKDDYGRESIGYVKFRAQKIAKKRVKMHSCLPEKFHFSKGQSYVLRKFIPRARKTSRSIAIHELFIQSMSFKDSKQEMLKKFELAASKNLILTAGSLSLHKNDIVLKLLPGNCVFGVPLEKFN